MRVLLHDAVAVAGDPDVVLVVDEAAVMPLGRTFPIAQAFATLPAVSNSITVRRGPNREFRAS